MRLWQYLAIVVLGATPTNQLVACETEPDLVQMPGENSEAFEARLEKTHADQWVIRRYLRETYDYVKSSAVYVARVATAHPSVSGRDDQPWVTVEPLHAIKGSLPRGNRKLEQTNWASCGNYGDGDAVWASVGEIVFVFEGLPKVEQRPNGIDSIRAADARTFELLDPLYQFGSEHPFKAD